MFAYFRGHRRTGSGGPPSAPFIVAPQAKRPLSVANLTSVPSLAPSTAPQTPTSTPPSSSRHPTQRFYARSTVPDEPSVEHDEERISTPVTPIPIMPPVLPPIPRVAESVEDKGGHFIRSRTKELDLREPLFMAQSPYPGLNPLKLNAVPPNEQRVSAKLIIDTTKPPAAVRDGTHPPNVEEQSPARESIRSGRDPSDASRPVSQVYSLDFGDDFSLQEVSPVAQDSYKDQKDSAVDFSSPSAWQTIAESGSIPPIRAPLEPPVIPGSAGGSSPSSATSSFERHGPPYTTTAEHVSNGGFSNLSRSIEDNTLAYDTSIAPPTVIKLSKPRRSLLNPVSLLKRRKTANRLDSLTDSKSVDRKLESAITLPRNYDPRIKGNRVHDFSVPRTRRNHSTTDIDGLYDHPGRDVSSSTSDAKRRESSPWLSQSNLDGPNPTRRSLEREHSPIFFENFEDNNDSTSQASVVRREALANPAFLARISERIPATINHQSSKQITLAAGSSRESTNTSPVPTVRITPSQSPSESPVLQAADRPLRKLEGAHAADLTSQLSVPPQHRASTASRHSQFSFQMTSDTAAAEEHELEEKHKRRSAEKKNITDSGDLNVDDLDDEFDESVNFDDDMDNQYEEPVPGVNANADEDESHELMDSKFANHQTCLFRGPESVAKGNSSSFASVANAPQHAPSAWKDESDLAQNDTNRERKTSAATVNDEMYFDDGQIETVSRHPSRPFDESVFDNPSSFRHDHCDRYIEQDKTSALPLQLQAGYNSTSGKLGSFARLPHDGGGLGISADGNLIEQPIPALDSGNLDAYHSALAFAATKAEADGKFTRFAADGQTRNQVAKAKSNLDNAQAGAEHIEANRPRDDYFSNINFPSFGEDWSNGREHGMDDVDFDADFDDSALIEAANSEALAADDAGFYGREFNFYGNDKKGREAFNGGYFGDGKLDGIVRHCSLRDPTLTPITERSEFSRAPSYMSLSPFGPPMSGNHFAAPLPSPGLKELAARIGMDSDEMSLRQLLKLRKDAFGGGGHTTGSSGSSPSSYASSPLLMKGSMVPPHPLAPEIPEETESNHVPFIDTEHGRRNHFAKGSTDSDRDRSETSSTSPKKLGTTTFPDRSKSSIPSSPMSKQRSDNYFTHASPSSYPAVPAIAKPTPRRVPIQPILTSSPLSNSSPTSVPLPTAIPLSVPSAAPLPSPQIMQKFAGRPPASSATYAERIAQAKAIHQRNASGGPTSAVGSDSVAYVREDDSWYLEKRRTLGSGEVLVLGRELVEGGKI